MGQIHTRFSDEQVKILLQSYDQRKITRSDLQDMLGIEKSRFFALWRAHRQDPNNFSIIYRRKTPARLSTQVETEIQTDLLREKQIVEDPNLPISDYNHTALRNRLKSKGIEVSVTTITDRAKKLAATGGPLVQHDGSSHLWSPFPREKWIPITSIDDYSRKILFADFFPKKTGP